MTPTDVSAHVLESIAKKLRDGDLECINLTQSQSHVTAYVNNHVQHQPTGEFSMTIHYKRKGT